MNAYVERTAFKVTAPVRFPRFFVTSPAPRPYLAGRTERKVFTELKGPHAEALNDALGRIGFRRSQTVAYRPSCLDCQACVSVRVVAQDFEASNAQRRNMRRNEDLVVTECRPWATAEQFDLLQRYLGRRHPGPHRLDGGRPGRDRAGARADVPVHRAGVRRSARRAVPDAPGADASSASRAVHPLSARDLAGVHDARVRR